ncbi:MAG: YigZ family protein [Planctomycetota bacterium]
MRDAFDTLAGEVRHEGGPIKGSRFVATAAPAPAVAAAEEVVARVRAELAGATHHCWAYRIGPGGESFRANDDGEPGGSAGRPILAQIEGHGFTDTVVVVTRWFGGTKLGVGGLMRAYGGAAGRALDRAPRRTVLVTRRLLVVHPYDCSGPVRGLLAAEGLVPAAADYGAEVRLVLDVPVRSLAAFTAALRDRSAGRAAIRDAEDP